MPLSLHGDFIVTVLCRDRLWKVCGLPWKHLPNRTKIYIVTDDVWQKCQVCRQLYERVKIQDIATNFDVRECEIGKDLFTPQQCIEAEQVQGKNIRKDELTRRSLLPRPYFLYLSSVGFCVSKASIPTALYHQTSMERDCLTLLSCITSFILFLYFFIPLHLLYISPL